MKKLLSLMLCIIFVSFALVSCAEDIIGDYLPNYNTNTVTDDEVEKLNFYIITGDSTAADAKTTVPQNINAYLKERYKIELNIVYCTEAEYNTTLRAAMNNTDETKRPDIILINNKMLFDTLYVEDSLVALNSFYNHRDFRSINTIVDDVLLSASAIVDPETGISTYYSVPNNHVIGEYKYVVIDKAMARDILHFSNSKIEAMTTEASLTELKEAIGAYYDTNGASSGLTKDEYVGQYVKIVSGDYDDKLLLEHGVESEDEITSSVTKNIVNVNSYPTATKDEAFLSAFAIVKHLDDTDNNSEEHQSILTKHYTKCMKIIYALNTDVQFKNMLQYGFSGTNYKYVKDEKQQNTNYVNLITTGAVAYEMNPIHTGNLFISYYCEEIGWNEQVHSNILRQNADAKTETQKTSTELKNVLEVLESVVTADSSVEVNLPLYGTTYSDVVITWTSNSEYAVVAPDGTLTFVSPDKNTTVTLSMSFEINGVTTGSGNFEITILPDATNE